MLGGHGRTVAGVSITRSRPDRSVTRAIGAVRTFDRPRVRPATSVSPRAGSGGPRGDARPRRRRAGRGRRGRRPGPPARARPAAVGVRRREQRESGPPARRTAGRGRPSSAGCASSATFASAWSDPRAAEPAEDRDRVGARPRSPRAAPARCPIRPCPARRARCATPAAASASRSAASIESPSPTQRSSAEPERRRVAGAAVGRDDERDAGVPAGPGARRARARRRRRRRRGSSAARPCGHHRTPLARRHGVPRRSSTNSATLG